MKGMHLFGVRLLGVSPQGLHKLVLTFAVLALAFLLRALLRSVRTGAHNGDAARASRRSIWARKSLALAVGGATVFVLLSIWFDDPKRLATFGGLIGAGIAFASQNAMLSLAGFFVIVFGKVFDLGDRVEFGGIRGDVLDIGLFKTTVMEMGVPPALQPDPNHWVSARQYTGRQVTITNSEIFKKPVFNYSAGFDLIFEEMKIPVKYGADYEAVEQLLLQVATEATREFVEQARSRMQELRGKYLIQPGDMTPHCFVRLTDNWIELTVRFVVTVHGVRAVKDRMSREILAGLQRLHIEIASSTYEIVGLPSVEVHQS